MSRTPYVLDRGTPQPVTNATWDFFEVEAPTTACRHKKADCARCGTTSRRDVVHLTQDGRGVVARLRRRR